MSANNEGVRRTGMNVLYFTVDAALLEELGQRLVGKPYIALAELVKNSYDADSLSVEISINSSANQIVIQDFGHGMTFEEFRDLWMRVGSTHKLRQKLSRNYKRPLTGSKGVGRLAVQFLAEEMILETVSETDLKEKLVTRVLWKNAVQAGDLTKAAVNYEVIRANSNYNKGTKIILTDLKHKWGMEDINGLAREIWWLKPPFRSPIVGSEDPRLVFDISFKSDQHHDIQEFEAQITAIMDIWYAKIVGQNKNGQVNMSLQYAGEEPISYEFEEDPNWTLEGGDFEIRVYNLFQRQPRGIRVNEARKYFDKHGGIHVYDRGFHLPYYGNPENDWVKVQSAFSHRGRIARLLPKELQQDEALYLLPSLSRLFGIVNVESNIEPDLEILITRDRFRNSNAFDNLSFMIRRSLEFFAVNERRRRIEIDLQQLEIIRPKEYKIQQVLERYRESIPKLIYFELKEDIETTLKYEETEAERKAKQISLMGPLATAGMASLAYRHETQRQFNLIDDILFRLEELSYELKDLTHKRVITRIRDDIQKWVQRLKEINAIFDYYQDTENIQVKERYSAKKILEEIIEQVGPLTRGIPIDISRIGYILLPLASQIEWSSIFQNVLTNAFNALIDVEIKRINISYRTHGMVNEILIQDNGIGVDLSDADLLFNPFVRKMEISPERRALGYGGMGLGLTIVRLVAYNIGCEVSFVEPEKGFNTAFSLRWREKNE